MKRGIIFVISTFIFTVFTIYGFFSPRSVYAANITVDTQVNSSADDVTEDSSYNETLSTMYIGNAGTATPSFEGMRFTNVTIPQGAKIVSATLSVYSTQSQWQNYTVNIFGDATNNSPIFSSTNKPSQRTLTSQTVTYSSNVQWLANTWYTLPDLTPIIQAAVNQSGWISGNALSIIYRGTAGSWGRKFIQSYNGSAANAPKLSIVYAVTGPTPTTGPTPLPTLTPTNAPTPTGTIIPTPTAIPTATTTPTPSPTFIPTTPLPTPTPDTSQGANNWPQLQYNAQHIGRTQVQVNPNYSARWVWMDKNHIVKNFVSTANKSITDGFEPNFRSDIIFAGQVQPVTTDGRTFFGATNGTMYAVNSLTGDNLWDYTTQGPIFASAAVDNAVVVVPSMDGNLYGLNASNGSVLWTYTTEAGLSAAPAIFNGIVYIGSRDGSFYAINVQTGVLVWKYIVRDPNAIYDEAPIMSPAAVSEDGQTVVFGAENMYFYGLHTVSGTEKWVPIRMKGQTFQFSWPVITGNRIIVRTGSSVGGTETVMDDVLASLSANPLWSIEKPAIANWLTANPSRKTMYVLDLATGIEPFQVAMGTVGSGDAMTPHPPVLDNQGRLLTYWRTKVSTFLGASPQYNCFGTDYCPDIGAIDMGTGDRITIPNNASSKFHPEIDNTFYLSVGGSNLYFDNGFRGTLSISLTNGSMTRISTTLASQDGGNFRGWPYQVIYYGNDSQPTVDIRPSQRHAAPQGWSPVSLAKTGSTSMMYVTEPSINAIVGIVGQ